ncbi:hypothetical protein GCM10022232_16600 [Streptomyces plumbiresistens]|uniref:Uncharacterized protein n=1 Tax=Streptomyces plumbiresistens TaxID=511811 RepID=A0ABP7QLG3_9ACTN
MDPRPDVALAYGLAGHAGFDVQVHGPQDLDLHTVLLEPFGDDARQRPGVGGFRRPLEGAVDHERLHVGSEYPCAPTPVRE